MRLLLAPALAIVILSACTAAANEGNEPSPVCRVTTAADRDTDPPAGAVRILGDDSSLFGNRDLWVVLAPEPSAEFDPKTGLYQQKMPWYRGTEGTLEIEGRWLDGAAQLAGVDVPSGYGPTGMQPTALYFGAPGCWEIRGTLASSTITFVIEVGESTG